jgi:hypothetical protein
LSILLSLVVEVVLVVAEAGVAFVLVLACP